LPALNTSQAPGTRCTTTLAPVARASRSNSSLVGSTVVSMAQRTATLPPSLTASAARAASTRRIGTAAFGAAASAAGPRVEQVRRTAFAPLHSSRNTWLVCPEITGVSPPACSAAASKSARTAWRSSTPIRPDLRSASSNTWTLLSAVWRQTIFCKADLSSLEPHHHSTTVLQAVGVLRLRQQRPGADGCTGWPNSPQASSAT